MQHCIVATSGTGHRSFLAYMASQACVDHDVLQSGAFEGICATNKRKASVAMDSLLTSFGLESGLGTGNVDGGILGVSQHVNKRSQFPEDESSPLTRDSSHTSVKVSDSRVERRLRCSEAVIALK